MHVNQIDHLVLTVRNIEATCEFYSRVLGMHVVTFGGGRKAMSIGNQKINLHEFGHEFEPKAAQPLPGSADFCLITDLTIDEVIQHLDRERITLVEGPVDRTGAQGAIRSVYVRDPDENLVEIAIYKS